MDNKPVLRPYQSLEDHLSNSLRMTISNWGECLDKLMECRRIKTHYLCKLAYMEGFLRIVLSGEGVDKAARDILSDLLHTVKMCLQYEQL